MKDAAKHTKSEFSQAVASYLIGMAVVMKGVAKIEEFRHHPVAVVFLLATGFFMIIGTALRRRLSRKIRDYTALFHLMEGAALWVVAFLLRAEGSRHAWAVTLFAGMVYFIVGATHWRVGEENREQVEARLQSALGLGFLVAAFVIVGLGWHAHKPWMASTGLAIAVCGIVLSVRGRRARIRIAKRSPLPSDADRAHQSTQE